MKRNEKLKRNEKWEGKEETSILELVYELNFFSATAFFSSPANTHISFVSSLKLETVIGISAHRIAFADVPACVDRIKPLLEPRADNHHHSSP